MDKNSLHWIYFVGNTYNRVYIWCCKYGENRYCERYVNKKWRASRHIGLLNSCLGKWYQVPCLVVPLTSTRVLLISTRVSTHCQAILLRARNHYIQKYTHRLANARTPKRERFFAHSPFHTPSNRELCSVPTRGVIFEGNKLIQLRYHHDYTDFVKNRSETVVKLLSSTSSV